MFSNLNSIKGSEHHTEWFREQTLALGSNPAEQDDIEELNEPPDEELHETKSPSVLPFHYRQSNLQRSAQEMARVYSWYRTTEGVWIALKNVNYMVENKAGLTCGLVEVLVNPRISLFKQITLTQQLLFHTPLFFIIRNNQTLGEVNLAWDVFTCVKSLFHRIRKKRASSCDLIELGVRVGLFYIHYTLNRSTGTFQWAERDFCYRLYPYVDFVQHALSKIERAPCNDDEDEDRLFEEGRQQIQKGQEFIQGLKDQHGTPLEIEEIKDLLKALVARGVTYENLIKLNRIPSELSQDRTLSKFRCGITHRPVRFPTLITAKGEFKLCERAVLQQWYGPLLEIIPNDLRPQHIIPGLNCLPTEIVIVQRLDLKLLKFIEKRLYHIGKKLALLQKKEYALPKKDNFAGKWVVVRLQQHAEISNLLSALIYRVSLLQSKEGDSIFDCFKHHVLKFTVSTIGRATQSYSRMERTVFRVVSTYLLGVDPRKLDALDTLDNSSP